MVLCKDSEVYMRQLAVLLSGAVASRSRPSPERAIVEIVEVAPIPFTFTLKAPAAVPEPVSATAGHFPSLGPLPSPRYCGSDYEVHSVMRYGLQGQDHKACSVS